MAGAALLLFLPFFLLAATSVPFAEGGPSSAGLAGTVQEDDGNDEEEERRIRRQLAVSSMRDTDFGVPQNLGEGGPLTSRAAVLLRKSAEYMHDLYHPHQSEDGGEILDPEVLDACRNRHESCTVWAAAGVCESNAPFTGMYCGPACRSCEVLDPKVRCPVDLDADELWSDEAGRMNDMFERIADSYERVEVLSRPPEGPWVVSIDDFLSSEECDRFIAHGHAEGYYHSVESPEQNDGGRTAVTDVFSQGRVSEVRTSTNAWCDERCESDIVVDGALDRVFEDLLGGIGASRNHSEFLQLLRYQQGQRYGEHHDFVPHEVDRPSGPRVLTVYMYLNDVEEDGGGETRFPRLGNLTVTPRKGRVLLWPNVLDGNPTTMDDRTVHEAVEVRRGEKYGANLWVHLRDFRGPMERYCHL